MIVTCLLGDPVEHSVSNYLFGHFAKKCNLEYTHVKLRVSSENPDNIKGAITGLRAMNMAGCNITLPYKLDVIPLIDKLDDTAKAMGAVNTIVNNNGILTGYNTDGYGAVKSIETKIGPIKSTDQVLILGAGGTARAILYEVLKRTPNITVLNRSPGRLQKLYDDFQSLGYHFEALPLTEKNLLGSAIEANLIINATSVGMSPNNEQSLITEEILTKIDPKSPIKDKSFFDAVFNPHITRFLETPLNLYHARICPGLYMMIYQGVKAFNLWTGQTISEEIVEEVHDLLRKKLNNRE